MPSANKMTEEIHRHLVEHWCIIKSEKAQELSRVVLLSTGTINQRYTIYLNRFTMLLEYIPMPLRTSTSDLLFFQFSSKTSRLMDSKVLGKSSNLHGNQLSIRSLCNTDDSVLDAINEMGPSVRCSVVEEAIEDPEDLEQLIYNLSGRFSTQAHIRHNKAF